MLRIRATNDAGEVVAAWDVDENGRGWPRAIASVQDGLKTAGYVVCPACGQVTSPETEHICPVRADGAAVVDANGAGDG